MTFGSQPSTNGDLRSSALPGGSLIRALLDRRLMGLADMGGSSAIIGGRWSDIVSAHIDALIGTVVQIPGEESHEIVDVIRLDAIPQVAFAASKRSLQNSDFVLLGRRNGALTMQAADAKFSIETARSRQVSVEMLTALADVGPTYTDLLGTWRDNGEVVPGLFFAPQSAMTSYVLSGRRGITRATVRPDEVVLLESSAEELTNGVPGNGARRRLAKLDKLDGIAEEELLLGLYYVRLSSAASASWFDMHRPLLGPSREQSADFDAVEEEITRRGASNGTAYELITQWARDAEQVRATRSAINQAAGLPLPNRDLREWVLADAEAIGVNPPSLNRVRKELQRWVHERVLEEVGIIEPDSGDIGRRIAEIRTLVGSMVPLAREKTAGIVGQLGQPSDIANGRVEQVERDQQDVPK